jgi:hypothetical protein
MSNKERAEDLGRLAEKLECLCDHGLFSWNDNRRSKDTLDWFLELPADSRLDTIYLLAYDIEEIRAAIHDCYQIARWGDEDC